MFAENKVALEYGGLVEAEPSSNTIIAFIGDTHVGKRNSEDALSAEEFFAACREKAQDQRVHVVAITGDGLDKDAKPRDIDIFEKGLKEITASGKPVVYVWGNNEDRLEQQYQIKDRLRAIKGVYVLDGTEEKALILDLANGTRQAFIGAPRIASQADHERVRQAGSLREEVLAYREILNKEQLQRFRNALASTIPQRGMPIPAIILFHAPEELEMYDNYAHLKDDPDILRTALYTQLIIQHQQRFGNIAFGLFGHVEGGLRHFFIAGRPFINTCAKIIGKRFADNLSEGA